MSIAYVVEYAKGLEFSLVYGLRYLNFCSFSSEICYERYIMGELL